MIKYDTNNELCVAQLNQRSLSLSSRCQLFDQFQDRMSQHAVKLDFLRRVHRQNAPNRCTTHQHKKTIKVDWLPDSLSLASCSLSVSFLNSVHLITEMPVFYNGFLMLTMSFFWLNAERGF